MPQKRNDAETVPFTITLPRKAADALEVLVGTGLYGSSRAAVASQIILQHLQGLWQSDKLKG